MTYLPHCKVILSGVLGASALSGNEIWSTGHQITDTNFADLPSQAQADAIALAWRNAFVSTAMHLCFNVYLTRVQVVAIAADGSWRKNTDGSYMKREGVLTTPGTGAADSFVEYPVSSVASLRTSRAGAHGRGRMYWPCPAEPPDGTGYASSTSALGRAQRIRTAFQEINTVLATGTYNGVVAVASSAAVNTPVNAVSVDNVHDTQRRRRNALLPVKSVATL